MECYLKLIDKKKIIVLFYKINCSFYLRNPHELKKFNVGEGRYHITTGTREVSPVVREVGRRGGKRGVGGKCAVRRRSMAQWGRC
jgi:hypothetical protein